MKFRHWVAFLLAVSPAALAATDPPIAVTGLVSNSLHLSMDDLGNFRHRVCGDSILRRNIPIRG